MGTFLSIIGIFSGWIVFALEFYYFKNEWFYLWINRNILKYFKKTYTDWQLKISYEINKNNCDSIWLISKFQEFFESYFTELKVKITQEYNSRIRVTVGDERVYEFRLEKPDYKSEHVVLWLKTLKYKVVSSDYEDEINEIALFLEKLEKWLSVVENASYMLTVNFKNNNPYYGFMVKHIPMQKLQTFVLKFKVSNHYETIISAEKKTLIFDSRNMLSLRDTALKYLRLEQSLYSVN